MNICDKRVLVTGADGFIGSHLVESLLKRDVRVRALSLYNSFNRNGWLEEVTPNTSLEIVCGDVRDPNVCRQIVKDCDVVFHLAALIAIPYSYIAPASYIETNVNGTLNMCQAALEQGCSRFVQTSTSEVYGTARQVPIAENHPLQPQSPYSASKIASDMVARSFFYSFNLPVVVARPFNTYGPRQSARAVIPTIISQLASGMSQINLGDLTTTRDFNYVEDTCSGFISIAECDSAVGETLNIGSNREVSIRETFELIRDLMGSGAVLKRDDARIRPANSEVQRLLCDSTKVQTLTDWSPRVSLEEGLQRTITWFSHPENLAKYKPDVYNV